MRRGCLVWVLSLAVLLLVGLAAVAAEENVLKLGNRGPINTIDPGEVLYMMEGQVTLQIYEPLLTYDLKTYAPVPHLAQKWEYTADLTSIVLYLRQGVKFHDGTPFNAEAVVFSFDRMKALALGPADLFKPVVDAVVVSEYAVKLTSDRPFGLWEDRLASYVGLLMVSPTYVRAHATASDPWARAWMAEHACGTGPYTLDKIVKGQYVEMVKFPDYWRSWTGVEFDKVRVVIVADSAMRGPMLQRGETDTGSTVPDSLVPQLKKDPNLVVDTFPAMCKQYLFLKCSTGPLANKTLRKCVEYALDLNEIASAGQFGAKVSPSPLPYGMIGYDPSLVQGPRDVEKSKALLAEAGYKPGELTLTMMSLGEYVESHRKIAAVIKQELAEIGINVEIVPVQWGEFIAKVTNSDTSTDMYFAYNLAFCAEPYFLLYTAFHPDEARNLNSGWNNGYINEEVGTLLNEAERTVNRDQRAEIYKQISGIVHEDTPVIYLYDLAYTYEERADLRGVDHCRFDVFTYWAYNIYRTRIPQ